MRWSTTTLNTTLTTTTTNTLLCFRRLRLLLPLNFPLFIITTIACTTSLCGSGCLRLQSLAVMILQLSVQVTNRVIPLLGHLWGLLLGWWWRLLLLLLLLLLLRLGG